MIMSLPLKSKINYVLLHANYETLFINALCKTLHNPHLVRTFNHTLEHLCRVIPYLLVHCYNVSKIQSD